jgi:hypothetical protein
MHAIDRPALAEVKAAKDFNGASKNSTGLISLNVRPGQLA